MHITEIIRLKTSKCLQDLYTLIDLLFVTAKYSASSTRVDPVNMAESEFSKFETVMEEYLDKNPNRKNSYHWDSKPIRPRLRVFLCCVTGEEIAVLVAGSSKGTGTQSDAYFNIFVPTVCGSCQKRTAPQWMTLSTEEDLSNDLPPGLRVELSRLLLKGWKTLQSVENYCKMELRIVSRITHREIIVKELQKYESQMHSATLADEQDGETETIQLLPYFDLGFL